jgi:hypothetical protein
LGSHQPTGHGRSELSATRRWRPTPRAGTRARGAAVLVDADGADATLRRQSGPPPRGRSTAPPAWRGSGPGPCGRAARRGRPSPCSRSGWRRSRGRRGRPGRRPITELPCGRSRRGTRRGGP